MSNVVDWNSIGSQKGGSKSDLIFLNAKNLPKVLLPSEDIIEYESFFDKDLGRSRPPKEGEKARTQYLFYGMLIGENGEKEMKIFNAGVAVARGINSVLKSLQNLGLLSFVKVTSTGSGLNTEYEVEAVKVVDKPIPTDIWNKLKEDEEFKKLPKLDEIKDRLLGVSNDNNSQDEKEEEGGFEDVTPSKSLLDI